MTITISTYPPLVQIGYESLLPSCPEDLEKITEILSAPDVVFELAANGHSDSVIKLLDAIPIQNQLRILSAVNAIVGLAVNEQAPKLISLIKVMPSKERAQLLSVPHLVDQLAIHGKISGIGVNDVFDLVNDLPAEFKLEVLACPDGVRGICRDSPRNASKVLEWINNYMPDQRRDILNAYGTMDILFECGKKGALGQIIANHPDDETKNALIKKAAFYGVKLDFSTQSQAVTSRNSVTVYLLTRFPALKRLNTYLSLGMHPKR